MVLVVTSLWRPLPSVSHKCELHLQFAKAKEGRGQVVAVAPGIVPSNHPQIFELTSGKMSDEVLELYLDTAVLACHLQHDLLTWLADITATSNATC